MTTPFPFDLLLVFGFLSVMLLVGVIFRAWIKFFQKLLFPSSLIGGLLGLALINAGVIPLDPEIIKAFAYHFFNISFISVGLTPGIKDKLKQGKGKKILKGSLWMACHCHPPSEAFPGNSLWSLIESAPAKKDHGFLCRLSHRSYRLRH